MINPIYFKLVGKLILGLLVSCGLGILLSFLYKKYGSGRKSDILNHPCSSSRQSAIFACCAVIAVWFFQSALIFWMTSDDFYISCILNSVYAEENYCLFINPIFAKAISIISVIFPKADAKVLLDEIFVLLGIWSVFYIISGSIALENSVIILILFIAINNILNLLHLPYTSLTAELAVYGFFIIYAVYTKKADKRFSVIGTILLCFSELHRFKAFLLIIPFAALLFITEVISEKKKKRLRELVMLLLPALILCTVIFGVKQINDNSEKYKYAVEYNALRTEIVDYPQKPFEKCKEEFECAGISENDFNAVKNLILSDTDRITSDYLKNIINISGLSDQEKMTNFTDTGLSTALKGIGIQTVIIIVLLLAIAMISDASVIHKTELLLASAGGLLIYLFFYYHGRMVYYVSQSIRLGIWLVFISFFMNNKIKFRYSDVLRKTAFCAAVGLFFIFYSGIEVSPERSVFQANNLQTNDIVQLDGNEDNFYVWSVTDYSIKIATSDFYRYRKLLSEEFISHNIVDGEWMYSQPYYIDYMSRIGVDNPMAALIEREHTYYIANPDRCNIVLTYLQEHFDENVAVIKTGEINNTPIWKFLRE